MPTTSKTSNNAKRTTCALVVVENALSLYDQIDTVGGLLPTLGRIFAFALGFVDDVDNVEKIVIIKFG
jgi:hypothetical protein